MNIWCVSLAVLSWHSSSLVYYQFPWNGYLLTYLHEHSLEHKSMQQPEQARPLKHEPFLSESSSRIILQIHCSEQVL